MRTGPVKEKIGRKALFIGLPEEKEVQEKEIEEHVVEIPSEILATLSGVLAGEEMTLEPGRLPVAFQPLATTLNTLFQKMHEQELRLSCATRALDLIPFPLMVMDPSGRHLAVSDAYTVLAGASREQVLGGSATTPGVKIAFPRDLLMTVARGGEVSEQITVTTPGSEPRPFERIAIPIPSGRGDAQNVLIILQEVPPHLPPTPTPEEITQKIEERVASEKTRFERVLLSKAEEVTSLESTLQRVKKEVLELSDVVKERDEALIKVSLDARSLWNEFLTDLPVPLVTLDASGTVSGATSAFLSTSGYDLPALLGTERSDLPLTLHEAVTDMPPIDAKEDDGVLFRAEFPSFQGDILLQTIPLPEGPAMPGGTLLIFQVKEIRKEVSSGDGGEEQEEDLPDQEGKAVFSDEEPETPKNEVGYGEVALPPQLLPLSLPLSFPPPLQLPLHLTSSDDVFQVPPAEEDVCADKSVPDEEVVPYITPDVPDTTPPDEIPGCPTGDDQNSDDLEESAPIEEEPLIPEGKGDDEHLSVSSELSSEVVPDLGSIDEIEQIVQPILEGHEEDTTHKVQADQVIVQFELGGEEYALDIGFTREIVEMMPITPIPRSPDYIVGVMNLRGEITTVLNINTLLGLSEISEREGKKIIVLSPEVAGGENLGIIVDDVRSVTQVAGDDIDQLGDALTSSQTGGRIKGIIKMRGKHSLDAHEKEGEQRDLVIWIDMQRVIEELMRRR